MRLNKFSINLDWLKIIALILMTLDHIAKVFPELVWSNFAEVVGRISFPIFSFILMYHLYKNQIYKKYLFRLGIFAFFTYLVILFFKLKGFDVLWVPFNILFMFFVCVLALTLKKWGEKKIKNRVWMSIFSCVIYFLCAILVCRLSLFVYIYVISIYYFFEKPNNFNKVVLLIFAYLINFGGFYGVIVFCMTVLLMNVDYDKRHQRIIKKWYIFYLYYPLHLMVLLLISSKLM